MARTRQKAKQRKAKRLAEERRHAGREKPKGERAESREERLEEIEQEGVGRQTMTGSGAAADVELAQAQMDAELRQAQEDAEAEATTAPEGDAQVEAVESQAEAPEAPEPRAEESKRVQRRREKAAERAREAQRVAGKDKRKERAERPAKHEKDKKAGKPAGKQAPRRAPRERGRVLNFFVQVWAELKRVQWPTRDQVFQAAGVVIGFCIIAGAYLALWDLLWNDLVKRAF